MYSSDVKRPVNHQGSKDVGCGCGTKSVHLLFKGGGSNSRPELYNMKYLEPTNASQGDIALWSVFTRTRRAGGTRMACIRGLQSLSSLGSCLPLCVALSLDHRPPESLSPGPLQISASGFSAFRQIHIRAALVS